MCESLKKHWEIKELSRNRLVVRTPRCGRGNPGSNPGYGKLIYIFTQQNVFADWSATKIIIYPVIKLIEVTRVLYICKIMTKNLMHLFNLSNAQIVQKPNYLTISFDFGVAYHLHYRFQQSSHPPKSFILHSRNRRYLMDYSKFLPFISIRSL